MNTVHLNHRRH